MIYHLILCAYYKYNHVWIQKSGKGEDLLKFADILRYKILPTLDIIILNPCLFSYLIFLKS